MRKRASWALVVFMLFILSTQSLAMGGRPQRGPQFDRAKMEEHIIKKLELTDKQQAAFEAGQKKFEEELAAGREKVKKISAELKAELQKDSPDRRKIHGYIGDLGKLHNAMQIKRMDSMLDLREMLTPEQKGKFKQMLNDRKARADKKGKRPQRRGGPEDEGAGPPLPPPDGEW